MDEAKPSGERREQRDFFTGPYCVTIIPDEATAQRAKELARQLAPDAEYQTEIPHITLFQGQMKELPAEEVKRILEQLKALQGKPFDLGKLEIFAGQYLFWDVANTRELQEVHEIALQLVSFVDPEKIGQMPHKGLNLTSDQERNAMKNGFVFSGDSFLPHITLAAGSKGLSLPSGLTAIDQPMTVAASRFGTMGENGRVGEIIELE